METKPWWQSKILWTSVVALFCWGISFAGHHVDPGTQVVLVNEIMSVVEVLGPLASTLIVALRFKSNKPLTKGK